jgi:hypothetical protein
MNEIDVSEGRAAARERVAGALRLEPGETLERAYIFEPVERQGVAFLLALVTKRLGDGRLEMAALGSRADAPGLMELEFARRARFPEEVLTSILAELIDRCDVEGAAYREVDLGLDVGTAPAEQVAALVDRLFPSDGAT